MTEKRKFARSVSTGQPVRKTKTVLKRAAVLNELAREGLVVSGPKGMPKTKVEALLKKAIKRIAVTEAGVRIRSVNVKSTPSAEERDVSVLRGSGLPGPSKVDLPWASDQDLEEIAEQSGLLSSDEISRRLHISRETTNRWRKEGRILGFELAKRGYRYPPEQIGPREKPLEGIDEIVKHFDGDHWAAWRILSQELPELDGMTGFSALARGKLEDLRKVLLARDYGSFT